MVELANEYINIVIAPEAGGRIVQFVDKQSGYDFLWRNQNVPLSRERPGANYDPNFFGGIDELLPNDLPETVDGVDCPDHGELWTAEFELQHVHGTTLEMQTVLPGINFQIQKKVSLHGPECRVSSRLTNLGPNPRHFLWKLHAALAIEPGDQIECSAHRYVVADPDWSRRQEDGKWQGETVPIFDGTTEFLYLHELKTGSIGWRRGRKSFEVTFDENIFPYAWYFASYGGFDGHHVAILEPCTIMPISVNQAARLGQCPALAPGQMLQTQYSYRGIVDEN